MLTYPGKFLFFVSICFAFLGCTRSAPDTSKITFKTPAFGSASGGFNAAQLSQSMNTGIMANSTKWGVTAPVNGNEINCFALLVLSDDLTNDITCSKVDLTSRKVHAVAGVFPENTEASIEITSGPKRTFVLLGFKTANSSLCVPMGETGGVLAAAKFSPPMILSTITTDVTPGEMQLSLSVPASISESLEDCSPKPFATNSVEAVLDPGSLPLAITTVSPSINVNVEGYLVDTYQYELVQGQTCAGVIFDEPAVLAANNIQVNMSSPSYAEGYYTLCVLAKTSGGPSQSVPTSHTFIKDTTAPVVTSISVPQFGNNPQPSVSISGPAVGDTVQLFGDSGCTTSRSASQVVSSTGAVAITADTLGTNGTYSYYARAIDTLGNAVCSAAAAYTFDTFPPTFTSLTNKVYSAGSFDSPVHSWAAASDTLSGIAEYKVRVANTGGDVYPATSVGSSLSFFYLSSFSLSNGQTHTIYVRAYDKAGNYTELTDNWTPNGDPPSYPQQAYIKASNGQMNQQFGTSVAIDGEIMVVGQPWEDSDQLGPSQGAGSSYSFNIADSGAAFVYQRTGVSWTQVAYLKAKSPRMSDQFGWAVAISGDTIAVAAQNEKSPVVGIFNSNHDDDGDDGYFHGAVYIFKKNSNGDWLQEAYIKAPFHSPSTNDYFGHSIALHKDVLVVGAIGDTSNKTGPQPTASFVTGGFSVSGGAHVYKRIAGAWTYSQYLKPPANGTNYNFAWAVDVYGDRIVVGAPGVMIDGNSNVGAAYVFKENGTNYVQESALISFNPETADYFGYSVKIFDKRIAVGAPFEDSDFDGVSLGPTFVEDENAFSAGAVYVFENNNNDSTWSGEACLKAGNSDANDRFGQKIGMFGSTVIVGSFFEQSQTSSTLVDGVTSNDNSYAEVGAAYVFRRNSIGQWASSIYLKPGNGTNGAAPRFGSAVAVSGSTFVVSAPTEASNTQQIVNGPTPETNTLSSGNGAVFVYEAGP